MSNQAEILKKLSFGVKRKSAAAKIKPGSKLSTTTTAPALVETQVLKPIVTETKRRDAVEEESTSAPEIIKGLQVSTERQGKSRKRKRSDDGPVPASKRREMVNSVRKANKIFVWGTDIADPCTALSTLDLPDQLVLNLQSYGLTNPTPVQMQAIPLMINRREVLASAPTGSGKTLAFALPVIMDVLKMHAKKGVGKPRIRAVVLEPTRELAKQTYIEFLKFTERLPISCALMDGDSVKTKTKKCDILVSTPNKLVFALQDKENPLKLSFVRWLVVDESDRLFDTTEGASRSFRDQLATVYQACSGKDVRRAFFSATFSYEVEEWCKTNLDNVAMICIGQRNSAVDTVEQQLVFTGTEQGKLVALRQLFNGGFEPPALVFVQSKDRARQLAAELSDERVPIDVIHSDRSQKEREDAIHKFRTGKLWVLICTEVLSRGIDFKGVNLVVNFDLPTSTVSYIHRIGRTGRAGRNGRAVTFFTERDTKALRPIANVLRQSGCEVPEFALRLNAPSRNMKKELLRHAPRRKNISFGGGRNKKQFGKVKANKLKNAKSAKVAAVEGATST